jgi:hypothetical protein
VQVGHALTPGVWPRARKPAARGAGQGPRRAPQKQQRDPDPAGEHGPLAPASDLQRRQRDRAGGERRDGREPPWIEAPVRRRHLPAQRGERRHPAHREQRRQREDERHPEPHPDPERHRAWRHRRVHVHRQEPRQQPRKRPLGEGAERRARGASDEPHRRGLESVDGEHPAGARAEAAEHRDGVEPLADEDDDRARDAHPSEQQRDEPHEPEIAGEASERIVQVCLVLRDGADPYAPGLEHGPIPPGQRLGRLSGRKPHERFVLGARSETEQMGGGEVPRGDVDPRAERGADPDVPGGAHHAAADDEARLAEHERVTHAGIQRRQERGLHHHAAALLQPGPCIRGIGADLAVEGVARLDGGHLHEPGAAGARHVRHRGEAGEPRDAAASPSQRVEHRLGRPGKRLAGREGEIGAEQRPRLAADGVAQVVGERTDRHERGHADGHRGGEQQQPARVGPDLPRRHAQHEGNTGHAALSATIDPSARRMVRRASAARS